MLPLDHRPNLHPLALLLLRGLRWVIRNIRQRHLEEPLSWLIWLLSISLIALWTQIHYRPPTEPSWVGMTIHTSVFAIWLLVVREWLALRWTHQRYRRSRGTEEPA